MFIFSIFWLSYWMWRFWIGRESNVNNNSHSNLAIMLLTFEKVIKCEELYIVCLSLWSKNILLVTIFSTSLKYILLFFFSLTFQCKFKLCLPSLMTVQYKFITFSKSLSYVFKWYKIFNGALSTNFENADIRKNMKS